jgi:hypothetical protein
MIEMIKHTEPRDRHLAEVGMGIETVITRGIDPRDTKAGATAAAAALDMVMDTWVKKVAKSCWKTSQ